MPIFCPRPPPQPTNPRFFFACGGLQSALRVRAHTKFQLRAAMVYIFYQHAAHVLALYLYDP